MADFERRRLEIELEFVHRSFAGCNNFSEGSFKTKKDAQVIRVRGAAAPRVFNSNYLFELVTFGDVDFFTCNVYLHMNRSLIHYLYIFFIIEL